jgi:hypothetical protein
MVLRLLSLFLLAALVVVGIWFLLQLAESYIQLFSLIGAPKP